MNFHHAEICKEAFQPVFIDLWPEQHESLHFNYERIQRFQGILDYSYTFILFLFSIFLVATFWLNNSVLLNSITDQFYCLHRLEIHSI